MRLGTIEVFYIGAAQFAYDSPTELFIEVVPGHSSGVSFEAPEGMRFLTLAGVLADAQAAAGTELPRGRKALAEVVGA